MFEGFRRRNEPEISPWPEQIPEAAPEPPLEQDVYHVPPRFDTSSAGPLWAGPGLDAGAGADLDPQRLDGRSGKPTRPAPPGEPALGAPLAEFLTGRPATPPEVPRARSGPAPQARPPRGPTAHPKPAEPPQPHGPAARSKPPAAPHPRGPVPQPGPADGPRTRGPVAPPKPAETVRSLFREATRVRERPAPHAEPPVTPADPAANTRVLLRLRTLAPAALARSGMDVETRPNRSFPVRWPGASRETRVRPEYHGVGVLRPTTPAPTRGLGLLFPPHTGHPQDSTTTGAPCALTEVDHVHIRQAVVAPDDPLRSGPVQEILPGADPGILRKALREAIGGRHRAERQTSIHRAETVQLGDDALIRLDPRYVVERTIIPAGALLAAGAELAHRYLDLLAAESDDPATLAAFLTDLIGAAAADGNLLGYADGLPEQRAAALGLFGMVDVDRATGVLIGAGDHLPAGLDLDRSPGTPP